MGINPGELLIDDSTVLNPVTRDRIYVPVIDGTARGHGLVPRDYTVHPPEMFDPPSQLTLIPRSEWSARIKEMEQTKSRISDVLVAHNIPSMDQGSNGYSHSADTEVLTNRGWCPWPEYDGTALLGTVNPITHLLEFQAPTERHGYRYCDEMYYGVHARLDFGVTRNHRMLVRKWDEAQRCLSDSFQFQRADGLGWYTGMLGAPHGFIGTELSELTVDEDRSYRGDDFVALMALIVSDGYAALGDPGHLSFCCFDEKRYQIVQDLAVRVGFHEQPSRRGVFHRYGAHTLANWVRSNCYAGPILKAESKKVPEVFKWSSPRQIAHFLDFFGDRNRTDGCQEVYYSSSKALIDDLQELLLRIGRRGKITPRGAREHTDVGGKIWRSKPSYQITVTDGADLSFERKKHLVTDRYNDDVFCATVPNGTLVTRRNGTVLISGNCWGHSTVGCVQAQRALANQPYVPLSAYMVCAIIKRGRNEGGWCGLSAKFLREVGVCSQALWPQGDRNTQRDTAEVRADAGKRKVVEDWVDLTRSVYDQNLSFDMVITCLLSRIPVAGDFNWWSHSVLLCDPVEVESGSFGIRMRNSWGDNWGDRGFSVLRGGKANTDGAVAVRWTNPVG